LTQQAGHFLNLAYFNFVSGKTPIAAPVQGAKDRSLSNPNFWAFDRGGRVLISKKTNKFITLPARIGVPRKRHYRVLPTKIRRGYFLSSPHELAISCHRPGRYRSE
jgi:hypothetical protein